MGTIAPLQFAFGDTSIAFRAPVVPLEVLPDTFSVIARWNSESALNERDWNSISLFFDEHLDLMQAESKKPLRIESVRVTSMGLAQDNLVVTGRFTRESGKGAVTIASRQLFAENHPSVKLVPVGEMKGSGFEEIHFFSPGASATGITGGDAVWTEPVTKSPMEKFRHALSFILIGVWHIFIGYDHILFLLGLHIISPSIKETIKIITAFTIAHSITLILAATGMVELSAKIVEPMIALSIVYIGLENLWKIATPPTSGASVAQDGRWKTASVFGLAHGFGFAGVLQEFLTKGAMDRPTFAGSLFAFNVGVEIGQIVVVAFLAPFWMNLRRIPGRDRIVQIISALISIAGIYWFMERI